MIERILLVFSIFNHSLLYIANSKHGSSKSLNYSNLFPLRSGLITDNQNFNKYRSYSSLFSYFEGLEINLDKVNNLLFKEMTVLKKIQRKNLSKKSFNELFSSITLIEENLETFFCIPDKYKKKEKFKITKEEN